MLSNQRNNFSVRLIAISKDEAAYLPEWIFHHLKVGFDEIQIYVNNTKNNSLDILEKISSKYKQIQIIDQVI